MADDSTSQKKKAEMKKWNKETAHTHTWDGCTPEKREMHAGVNRRPKNGQQQQPAEEAAPSSEYQQKKNKKNTVRKIY